MYNLPNPVSNPDRPITQASDDKFGRAYFVDRIVDLIVNKQDADSLVIGVYGSWGEGKSSVLNMLHSQLEDTEGVICVNFNPWLYHNQEHLLRQFFDTLARELKHGMGNYGARLAKWIRRYATLLDVGVGAMGVSVNPAQWLSALAGVLHPSQSIEQLKQDIDHCIEQSGQTLVVLIDDIDRLDKDEVYAMLRLVKLTAGFANTVYILALDDEVVARAIGERFGANASSERVGAESHPDNAGKDYLEKIVQSPMRLPKVHPTQLEYYLRDELDGVWGKLGIKLSNDDRALYNEAIEKIHPCMDTPRAIIRYCHTLLNSALLLGNNIFLPDLIVLELLKTHYHEVYKEIRRNRESLIDKKSNTESTNSHASSILDIKKLMEREKINPEDFLHFLFPCTTNTTTMNDGQMRTLFYTRQKQGRVSSPHFFNLYFSHFSSKVEDFNIRFVKFRAILEEAQSPADIEQKGNELKRLNFDNLLIKEITETILEHNTNEATTAQHWIQWLSENMDVLGVDFNTGVIRQEDHITLPIANDIVAIISNALGKPELVQKIIAHQQSPISIVLYILTKVYPINPTATTKDQNEIEQVWETFDTRLQTTPHEWDRVFEYATYLHETPPQHNHDQGVELYKRLLPALRLLPNKQPLIDTLTTLCYLHLELTLLEQAENYYNEALATYNKWDEDTRSMYPNELINILYKLSQLERRMGKADSATQHEEEAIAISRSINSGRNRE